MTLCLQGFFPTAFQPSSQDVSPTDSTNVKRLTTDDAFKKKVLTSAVRTYPQSIQCRRLLSNLFLTEKHVFKTYLLTCFRPKSMFSKHTFLICVAQAIQGLLDRFQHPLHREGDQCHPITLFLGSDQFVDIWHDAAMSTGANAIAHLHASAASTTRTMAILEQEISVARCVDGACRPVWCEQCVCRGWLGTSTKYAELYAMNANLAL
jgi:hypothetical protein